MDLKKIIRSRWTQIGAAVVVAFALGFLVATLTGGSAPGGTWLTGSSLNLSVTSDAREGFNAISNIQAVFHDIAAKALPSVVEIDVVDVVKQPAASFNSPFDFFFGPQDNSARPRQREFRQEGLGSGFIVRQVDDKVYVLTNNHVVSTASEISVILADKRHFTASVVGKDEQKDLALVVFQTKERLPIATLGDSDAVQVGDWVIAMGTPLGLESTVTNGIVSAVGRKSVPGSNISSFTDYFQTDAAINQGNSGGALLNIHGEVIGINTWIASPSGGSVGLGFAIPINNAKKAVEDFITKGKVSYGWLGLSGGDITPEMKADLLIGERKGAFVYDVYKGSPAASAGIRPGDYIVRVNGQEISDMTQLTLTIGNLGNGTSASVEVLRGKEGATLTVQIGEKPASDGLRPSDLWPGLAVVKITDDIRARLNLSASIGSLVVSRVEDGSNAQTAGIRVGDIVKAVNGTTVNSALEFYAALNNQSSSEVLFSLGRGNGTVTLGLVR